MIKTGIASSNNLLRLFFCFLPDTFKIRKLYDNSILEDIFPGIEMHFVGSRVGRGTI